MKNNQNQDKKEAKKEGTEDTVRKETAVCIERERET